MTSQTRQLTPFNSCPKGEIMRRLQCVVFAAAAVIGATSIASAADMPVKAPAVWAAPATGPLWEGIYIGGNIGDAWGHSTWCTDAIAINCETGAPTDTVTATPKGLVGGFHAGDRWQFGNVVLGFEGLYDGLTIATTQAGPAAFPGQSLSTKFSGLMSVTGQAGWAVDRFLVYGKGGLAITDMKFQAISPAAGVNLSTSEYANGWTAGAGIEYQVIPHLIVGVEYDYYRFSPNNITNVTSGLVNCAVCNFGSSTNIQTVVGRLSIQAGPMPSWH
jgi:outer membrane immunogenic protein